jgi:eukaryotic-like serine/threonine-protein kinase
MLPITLGPRVWSAGRLLLLAGGLVATFLVFAVIAARVAVRARDVRVPELTGRTLDEARVLASDQGLLLRVEEARRPDVKVPAGHVLGQDPQAGSSSRRQRPVRIWLSSGARVVVAPRLVGESERAAQIRLAQEGVTTVAIAEIRDAAYAPGVVVAQDPPPDTETSEVRLLVNRGEDRASYVMPDLIGLNGDRASDLLRARGFRVSIVSKQSAPGIPPGVVIRQTPAGGYQVHPGDSISLEVSQ